MEAAKAATAYAYAPYSSFKVGAALLTQSGKIYSGCNVENASYSLTICAERNVIFQAIAEGNRDFAAMAVYVDSEQSFPPCGACRQVMAEFAADLPVFIANRSNISETTLAVLLPERFTLNHG